MAKFLVCIIVRPRFSRKLTAKFLVCIIVKPRFSRKLTAKFLVCIIVRPRFSRKLTAKFLVCRIRNVVDDFTAVVGRMLLEIRKKELFCNLIRVVSTLRNPRK